MPRVAEAAGTPQHNTTLEVIHSFQFILSKDKKKTPHSHPLPSSPFSLVLSKPNTRTKAEERKKKKKSTTSTPSYPPTLPDPDPSAPYPTSQPSNSPDHPTDSDFPLPTLSKISFPSFHLAVHHHHPNPPPWAPELQRCGREVSCRLFLRGLGF